jgi:membrane protease YdiL (CAAX protease family)
VLAAGIVGGRSQLRELGSRLTRVRVGWRWYAVVIFGPALAGGLVTGLSVMLGSRWIDVRPVAFGDGIVAVAVFFVVVSLTDGLGEEVGWRGYALPRLLERLPAVRATLLLGVVWAAWHLPLFWTDGAPLEGSPIWALFLRLPAAAIIFTWVFQHTQGSTVIAVLLHGAMNLFASPLALRPTIIAVALHWLIAVGLVAAERQERPTSKPRQSTIAPTDAKA